MWRAHYAAAAAAIVTAVAVQAAVVADEVHEGKVVAVGENKLTVLDNQDNDNDTFTVTADTKITRNGKAAKLSDIRPGDKAKVTATSRGDMLIAKEIVAIAPE